MFAQIVSEEFVAKRGMTPAVEWREGDEKEREELGQGPGNSA